MSVFWPAKKTTIGAKYFYVWLERSEENTIVPTHILKGLIAKHYPANKINVVYK